jgi:hypothetical protein
MVSLAEQTTVVAVVAALIVRNHKVAVQAARAWLL